MKIKIFVQMYEIEYRDDLDKTNDSWGQIQPFHNKILLQNNLPKTQEQDTILHESIHSISSQLKLGFDEPTIVRLTTALLQYMKDNKDLIRDLIDDSTSDKTEKERS